MDIKIFVGFSIWLVIITIWSFLSDNLKSEIIGRYIISFIVFCFITYFFGTFESTAGILPFAVWLGITTIWSLLTKQNETLTRWFYVVTFIVWFGIINYLIF